MPFDYIRGEAKAGRMGTRLLAIVAESDRGRDYLPPDSEHERIALTARANDVPETDLPHKALGFRIQEYGMKKWRDLFTPRQLVALTTFSDLIEEARELVKDNTLTSGLLEHGGRLEDGGTGATAYADAVAMYLALAIDKASDYDSALVVWSPTRDQAKTTFSRQALAMVWDFAEVDVFAGAAGDLEISLQGISRTLSQFGFGHNGCAVQSDAQNQAIVSGKVVSTDPPYYDNIGYGDLSDFFTCGCGAH
jgi:putative DNA methylase